MLAAGSGLAGELTVHAGQSIAAAIAQAAPGDVIRVEKGYYREQLLIDKPLTLNGINRPTISGGFKGDTIRVTAEDVTIDGLIVRDSGDSLKDQNAGIYIRPGAHRAVVRNCDLTYNLFGIYIETVNKVEIRNNVITGKRDYKSPRRGNGIQLYNTEDAQIIGNNISFVRDGIYVDVSHHAVFRDNRIHHVRYGTHYMNSHNNLWEDNDSYHNRGGLALMMMRNQVVRNNRAWGNSDHGIMLRTIQDSVIEGNIVAGNERGFFIYDAEYNTLRDNLVVDNTVGVHLAAGSYRNQVEGNDFISNRTQIKYVASAGRGLGSRQRQLLEQLRGLGPQRRRHRRCALRGQRPGRPSVLAAPDDEAAARQPGGADAATGEPAVPAAARTQRRRSQARTCSRTNLTGANGVADISTMHTETGAAVIVAHGVHKHYGPMHAVDGVDLDIRAGELFGLIGHNGAGKSTLFKMMLGLIPATAGEIRIDGAQVSGGNFRAVRRTIGYLPENVVLYDNLTGLETLHFFSRLKGASPAECAPALERVGLAHAAKRRVREYSKGMRQRLGFAQALLGKPRILFLDEPTTGLDPEAIRSFYAILRQLRSEGVTMVITSHILAEIQERVDRLAIMTAGKIQAWARCRPCASRWTCRCGSPCASHARISRRCARRSAICRWAQSRRTTIMWRCSAGAKSKWP